MISGSQQVTAEQLEVAIQQVIKAVDWSEPPRSDTVSGGERRRANDQAMAIVFAVARKAMQQQAMAEAAAEAVEVVPELAEISTNGDGEDHE